MIPLKDVNPTRTTPFIVYAIVIINVVVYLYNGSLSPNARNPLAGYELIPYELITGRNVGVHIPIGFWVTVFTAMFLHANLLHLGSNMLYLWIFGNNVEDVLGHFRFLAFYLVSGMGASGAQILTNPLSRIPMVGASGAIAGVLAAYLILFPRARIISLVTYFVMELPAYVVLGFWILLQVVNSFLIIGSGSPASGGVAFAAHVGGFATGLVVTLIIGGRRLLRGRQSPGYTLFDRY
jgi:membrane associated rhomboid family serine protease